MTFDCRKLYLRDPKVFWEFEFKCVYWVMIDILSSTANACLIKIRFTFCGFWRFIRHSEYVAKPLLKLAHPKLAHTIYRDFKRCEKLKFSVEIL